jgi:hypothetical protein
VSPALLPVIDRDFANRHAITDEDEEEGDNLEPISMDNIIDGGRRTRGKTIDFAEAAEKAKAAGDDDIDEDEDDEDFEVGEDDEMQE